MMRFLTWRFCRNRTMHRESVSEFVIVLISVKRQKTNTMKTLGETDLTLDDENAILQSELKAPGAQIA